MKTRVWTDSARLLGAAFLVVVVTSLWAGLFSNAAGSGTISEVLPNIARNTVLAQASVVGGLANSTGIVVLAVLLYVVLRRVNNTVALVALGLWVIEAVFYAVMQLGVLGLVSLGAEYVAAGSPGSSFYQVLGEFLYAGVYTQGLTIHMWFYCVGGILWYSMFVRSRFVPRPLSVFGVLAVVVGTVGIVVQLAGVVVPIFVFLPIGVFEIVIGVWLLLRGIPKLDVLVEVLG